MDRCEVSGSLIGPIEAQKEEQGTLALRTRCSSPIKLFPKTALQTVAPRGQETPKKTKGKFLNHRNHRVFLRGLRILFCAGSISKFLVSLVPFQGIEQFARSASQMHGSG